MFTAEDHLHMSRALQLAALGMRTTSPNPRVGCVIVNQGRIVGEGWHVAAGTPHAEPHALAQAGELARGATAYVTLEPCSHHGRTPPCADALVGAGLARVVVATTDPNPLVAGQGMARLRAAGILAESGLMEAEALALNRGFMSRMTRGRPWITVKLGMSLDGKTALDDGRSQWITGPAARRDVMRLRAESCAILTGSGTVMADDPQLTVRGIDPLLPPADCMSPAAALMREQPPRRPLRAVVDSRLATSPVRTIYLNGGVRLYTCVSEGARHAPYIGHGNLVRVVPALNGRVDLPAIVADLGLQGCNNLLVEAGMGLAGAVLRAGLLDELVCYVAPAIIGHQALGAFNLPPLASLDDKVRLAWHDVRPVGDDLRLTLRPVR
ncbi:bifunctional diaminohydroxyphosphoribosylaminopyrimidine deaminase/5-amino-6-(5-phosphoribosylamino)uracil reductase RibD [Microvirgula aerodenitrificans]|uniref:bifunctional diaminohydroxyphosphoribosylaminopyrimidine deaminase/5-amino-6-(5-phosphoribosylamino)uracil reductase RibD n=1 Tax=Microvirgula aerodenitrificans TaxID=57480 RepID=UPI00248EA82B|nr:bifunctional diaminohydroxyphosphoribosylaminopyrimidine deaminase/5-amino-6-(5-phosphoribosylamino)uracil reductase RibD [Microvirgula aerodenitrificans]